MRLVCDRMRWSQHNNNANAPGATGVRGVQEGRNCWWEQSQGMSSSLANKLGRIRSSGGQTMVVLMSGGCGGEAAKRAASRKKRLGMTRGRERRRLEGNKSTVIRVRPRHRPVDPVTQSTYWPRLGAPDGGRSTWAQVQLYSGLPSGARAARQGVWGSDLDLAHVPVSRYPSWSRYMAHHCDT